MRKNEDLKAFKRKGWTVLQLMLIVGALGIAATLTLMYFNLY